jgi:hypothetical protein
MWDMLQNQFGRWPYVCRRCHNSFYSQHRHTHNLKLQPKPQFKPDAGVAFTAQRQGAQAAVAIRAEDDGQLMRILLALSRAVEAEQQAANSTSRHRQANLVGASFK